MENQSDNIRIRRANLNDKSALALVEICNQSSLLSRWQTGQLAGALVGAQLTTLQKECNPLIPVAQLQVTKFGNTILARALRSMALPATHQCARCFPGFREMSADGVTTESD